MLASSTVASFFFVATVATRALTASSSSPLPLIIWHGLGDNYAGDGIKDVEKLAQQVHPGTYTYAIRLAESPDDDRKATFWGNTTEQIDHVCKDIAHHPILATAPAIDALGFSQGGLFLRAYVERCNKPPVRSLVTFGTPHNGIADYKACGDGDWLCKGAMALLHTNTWSAWLQSRLVPAQYYRDIDPETGLGSENYLLYSNMLADINNERPLKNVTYSENIANLEKLVMFKFDKDTTVIPAESEWFAELNTTSLKVSPLRERPIYTEDWLGLRQLDEKGGLEFKIAPGEHMQISKELLEETFQEYYGPARHSASAQDGTQEVLEL